MSDVRFGVVLAVALLLAVPAALLVNASFDPHDDEFRLQGRDGTHTFRLDAREPLELEYALTLRSSGSERPVVRIDINGATVIVIDGGRWFAPQTGKRLLPVATLHPHENEL